MKEVSIGIIGTGWCGGIRAEACSASPFVRELHIAEIREDRLKEVAGETKPVTANTDYHRPLENPSNYAIMISATPENTHYPKAEGSPPAGQHLLTEKTSAL